MATKAPIVFVNAVTGIITTSMNYFPCCAAALYTENASRGLQLVGSACSSPASVLCELRAGEVKYEGDNMF
jgi:hypothetical protein